MSRPFADLDTAAVARAMGQIADAPQDLADAYFERSETIELPPEGEAPGLRVWRESGLALRLVRGGEAWLAGRDRIDTDTFDEALRRIARAMPRAPYPRPDLGDDRWPEEPFAPELQELPAAVQRAVRSHRASFPYRLTVRRHRRWLLVVGTQVASSVETERFYSVEAELPAARYGTLLVELGNGAAEQLGRALVRAHRGSEAASPAPWRGPVVLGPAATAVVLHEAVAHALEADTLALGGHPEAAVGVAMGAALLHVVDDPASAPEPVRRGCDDEALPVVRRHLLRAGVVEQPLCDRLWARQSEVLAAGAARRGNRHRPPGPRSTHLELVPGELSNGELCAGADGGLYLPEVERGRLDPLTGDFTVTFPHGRRIENGVPGSPVGRTMLRAHLTDLLGKVVGVGSEASVAGAGWCAKAGSKMPVWATAPAIRLEGLEVAP